MMPSRLFTRSWAIAIGLCVLASLASRLLGDEPAAPAKVAADTCVLRLQAPPEAVITIDGRDYGTKREFSFSGLQPRTRYRAVVNIRFPDGAAETRPMEIEADRTLLIVADAPSNTGVLEIDAPEGTKLSVDGTDRGAERRWTFQPIVPGAWPEHKVVATLPNGENVERTVLIPGGQVVRLPLGRADNVPQLVPQLGNAGMIETGCFSPDGRLLVTGGYNRFVVRELPGDRQLRSVTDERFRDVAISPDGRMLATGGSWTPSVTVRELATGKVLALFPTKLKTDSSLVFSPDSRLLLTANTVWDIATGNQVLYLRDPSGSVGRGLFSPDGQQVLTVDRRTAVIWNLRDGSRRRTFQPQVAKIRRALFSPDGKQVFVIEAESDYEKQTAQMAIVVWDTDTGKELRRVEQNGFTIGEEVCITPDGRRLVVAISRQKQPQELAVWDAATLKPIRTLAKRDDAFDNLTVSRDGRLLFVATDDYGLGSEAQLWDLETGQMVQQFEETVPYPGYLEMSTDGSQALVGLGGYCKPGNGLYWETAGGRPLQVLVPPGTNEEQIFGATLSPNGQALALILGKRYGETELSLWDPITGQRTRDFAVRHTKINGAAFSPDGRRIVSAGGFPGLFGGDKQFGEWVLWDVKTGREIRSKREPKQGFRSAAFLPDGRRFVISGSKTALWDASSGAELRGFDHGAQYAYANVNIHPDGRRMLMHTGGYNAPTRFWLCDLQSGRLLREFDQYGEEIDRVYGFSPDGHLLACKTKQDELAVCEAATGRPLRTWKPEDAGLVHALFEPSGRYVYLACMDGSVRLWDIATGDELIRVHRFADGEQWLAVTPEGLVDGTPEAIAKVLVRVGDGLEVEPPADDAALQVHENLLADVRRGLRPMPTPKPAGQAPQVRIVAPTTKKPTDKDCVNVEVEVVDQGVGVGQLWLWHDSKRYDKPEKVSQKDKVVRYRFPLTLVPGDNRLEVGALIADGKPQAAPAVAVVRYEPPADKTAPSTTIDDQPELVLQTGHSEDVKCMALSPDGHYLATGGGDNAVILWDAATGQQLRTLLAHTNGVNCLDFSPDGQLLLSGGGEGMAVLWNVATGARLRTFEPENSPDILFFHPNGRQFFVARRVNKNVQLCDLATGNPARTFSLAVNPRCAAVSPDGSRLIVGCGDQQKSSEAILWDIATGKLLHRVSAFTEKGYFDSLTFSPDGRQVVGTAMFADQFLVWDVETGKVVRDVKMDDAPDNAAFSADGQTLAVACKRQIFLYDAHTGRLQRTVGGQRYSVERIIVSPDGSCVLTTGHKPPVFAWDAETGFLLYALEGHTEEVEYIAFSPDGKQIATATDDDNDQTIMLWDRMTGKRQHVLTGHAKEIRSLVFSPDGRRLLTTDSEPQAILWDAQTGTRLRSFKIDYSGYRALWSPDSQNILTEAEDYKEAMVLQDAATGDRKLVFRSSEEQQPSIDDAVFSPDGRYVYTGGGKYKEYGEVIRWDADTGAVSRTSRGHASSINELYLSSDGRRLLTVATDDTAILWDAESGQQIARLTSKDSEAMFSPDGRLAIVQEKYDDKNIDVWDARTGRKVRTFRQRVDALVMSPDGRILYGNDYSSLLAWDIKSGVLLARLGGHRQDIHTVAFTPDGKQVISGAGDPDRPAAFWDVESGAQRQGFHGSAASVMAVAYSPAGDYVLTASGRATIVWDMAAGELRRVLKGHGKEVSSIVVSPDGHQAVTIDKDGTAIRWDLTTGRELQTYAIKEGDKERDIECAAFSPDGDRLVTGGGHYNDDVGDLYVWDTVTGAKLRTLRGHQDEIACVAFSPDGRHVLTGAGYPDKETILWDIQTGTRVRSFPAKNRTESVAFSPDGLRCFIATSSYSGETGLWDVNSGRQLTGVDVQGAPTSAAFGPEGKRLITAGGYGNFGADLWNGQTGRPLRTLLGHTDQAISAAFSPTGKFIISGSKDGTARLWETATGKELVRLIGLDEGKNWLAVTLDGLFDGSPGGRKLVAWRIPGQQRLVPVDRFFNDFYRPGLLNSLAGGKHLKASVKLAASLPPLLKIVSPESGAAKASRVTIEVEAADRGGGVSPLSIYLNGSRMLCPGKTSKKDNVVHRTFQLALIEGENRVEVRGSSADSSWESEPATVVLRYEQTQAKPELYVTAVGVNRYAETTMNLKFAAVDAQTIAQVFQERAPRLYGADRTHITQLLDDKATKPSILRALRDLAGKAKPQDTIVVFLAGHGTMVGQRYYFIPHEFKTEAKNLEDDIRAQGLAGDEIDDAVSRLAAVKRVVIYDTCQSGGAVGLTRTARNPFVFRKALEQMSRAQGSFIIAATAASADAQEVPELGHGVLTYALLAGLGATKEGPLRQQAVHPSDGRIVGVRDWFAFAQDKVPTLTKLYFNEEQFVKFVGAGSDFPILPLKGD